MRITPHLAVVTLFALPTLALLTPSRAAAQVTVGSPCVVTPGIKAVKLANGDMMYYGRLPMNFPEDNTNEHSVRQIRIHLPLMQNDTATPTGQPPLVQATIEVNGIGAGQAMLLYGVERFEENSCAGLLIDVQTPFGAQSELPYFLNLTVIGSIKASTGVVTPIPIP